MVKDWENAIITKVSVALYVSWGSGHTHHINRPFHGFVLNDPSESDKDYYFSDGRVLRTKPGELFYLPKGSTYHVKSVVAGGGCWAINFDLLSPLEEEPFTVAVKNPAAVLELFKEAAEAFQNDGADRELIMRRNLYSILLRLRKEHRRGYVPSSKMQLIQPALDMINSSFSDQELNVQKLVELCGISSAYFRRIFAECMGMSPQEYIIERRLRYAKQLLKDKQFPVSEVAQMCGYSEPSHFSREFARRVGVPPRVYSNANQAE